MGAAKAAEPPNHDELRKGIRKIVVDAAQRMLAKSESEEPEPFFWLDLENATSGHN